ncbi:MAG: hypothetical protein ACO1NU_15825 [Arcticibacter sp.]
MENTNRTTRNIGEQNANANNPAHYQLLTIGIVITMIGVLLRFFGDWSLIDAVSNLILVVGVGICLRAVYKVLQ